MDYQKRGFWPLSIGFDATEGEKHLRKFLTTYPGEVLDPETRLFLWHGFVQILNGEDPRKALKLETKQGVKGSVAKARDKQKKIDVAVMVEERLESGMLKDDAREAVADELGIKYRTVCRYCTNENTGIAKDIIAHFKNKVKK